MEGRLGQGEEIYCRLLGEMRGTKRGEGEGGDPTATIGHIHHLHNGQICDILHLYVLTCY